MKKNIQYFFIFILAFSSFLLGAQDTNRTIDSLLNVLKTLSNLSPEVKLVKGSRYYTNKYI